jgi:hypothetical protein
MLQKKVTKEKGSLKSFLGFSIFSAVRAIQLAPPWRGSNSIAWQPSLQDGCFAKIAHGAIS